MATSNPPPPPPSNPSNPAPLPPSTPSAPSPPPFDDQRPFAKRLFGMGVAVPYLTLLFAYGVQGVPGYVWMRFLEFHKGIVASKLWAHQTFFVVVFSALLSFVGARGIWKAQVVNGFLARLLVFILPFVSGCLWKGPCSFLGDSTAVNASKLWWYDNGVLFVTSVSIAVVEGARYGFKKTTIATWVVGMFVLGHETLLPHFFLTLHNLELNVPGAARRDVFQYAYVWYWLLCVFGVSVWYTQVFEYVARGGAIEDEWEATIYQVGGSSMSPTATLNLLAIFLLFGPLCMYALPLWKATPPTRRRVTPSQLHETVKAWVLRYRFCIVGFSSVATCLGLFFYFREFEPNRTFVKKEDQEAAQGADTDTDDDDYASTAGSVDTDTEGEEEVGVAAAGAAGAAGAGEAVAAPPVKPPTDDEDESRGRVALAGLVALTAFLSWVMLAVEWAIPVSMLGLAFAFDLGYLRRSFGGAAAYVNSMNRTFPSLSPHLVFILPGAIAAVRHVAIMREYLHGIAEVMVAEGFFSFAANHFESWNRLLSTALIAATTLGTVYVINRVNADQGPGRAPVPPTRFSVKWMAALFGALLFVVGRPPAPCLLEPGAEYVADADYAVFERMMADAVWDGKVRRGQHVKAHGCVYANFTALPRVPERLRHGVFQSGATFPAWLRYSNGVPREQDDAKPDVRGVSLKLGGVGGAKELGDEHATQDFIFVSSETFFTATIERYQDLVNALKHPNPLVGLLGYAMPSLNVFEWDFGTPIRMARMIADGGKVKNPFRSNFFSTTAFRLGPDNQAVRYSLRPCPGSMADPEAVAAADDTRAAENPADYLQGAMVAMLETADVCLELLVQEQGHDACVNSVEDVTARWSGEWTPVAVLNIPRQEFRTQAQMDFCRTTSFNVWHSLPEHRPLGTINMARKAAYMGSSSARRFANADTFSEPTGLERFEGPPALPQSVGAGEPAAYVFDKYPHPFAGLPPRVRDLPEKETFSSTKRYLLGSIPWALNKHYLKASIGMDSTITSDAAYEQDFSAPFVSPDSFESMFGIGGVPRTPLVACWKEDAVWAQQYIAGINPMALTSTRVEAAHARLSPAHTAAVNAYLNATHQPPLAALHNASRLFFADYAILEGVQPKPGAVFYAPLAFLFRDNAGVLLPLAIRLEEGTMLTPDAPSKAWLFAKIHVSHADTLVHELNVHLLRTHLVMEPIIVAARRQLNVDHPILTMLAPHFFETLAINEHGRRTLLAEDPHFSVLEMTFGCGVKGALELMAKDFQDNFSLEDLRFPDALRKRGFDRVEPGVEDILPGFAYRDMGFLVWDEVVAYVTSVVETSYTTDDAMRKDEELGHMLRELGDPERGATRGVPTLTTRDDLIRFLSSIVFTATAQHSTVNDGQKFYMSMVPNRPTILHRSMPSNLDLVTDEFIVAALPSKLEATLWVVTTAILSLDEDLVHIAVTDMPTPESYGYPYRVPVKDEPPFRFHRQFADMARRLEVAAKKMTRYSEEHFDGTCVGYDWLQPHRIKRSVSV